MDTSLKKEQTRIFEENRILGGHNLFVIEDWGQKIKKRCISEKEKELYLKQFGKKMITDSEFYDWWCKINKLGPYDHDS